MVMGGRPGLSDGALWALRILFIICVAATAAFIFANSAQTGVESGAWSLSVTEAVNSLLSRLGPDIGISHEDIRRAGHIGEFALLGFFLALCLRSWTERALRHVSWPLLIGLVTALADELLQLSVPGRVGVVLDVASDLIGLCAGTAVGLALAFVVLAARERRRPSSGRKRYYRLGARE
jgi:VanZ family protein